MNLYNREDVVKLLEEHVTTKQLLKHSYAVEGSMKHYGELFNESVEAYGTCGLLHDIDFEKFPEDHPGIGLRWLEEAGYDADFVKAVKGHGSVDETRESKMAKTLFAVDELSSFVIAAALMRPTRFEGMQVKSIKKKMKAKAFAAAVNRETIKLGAEELNLTLEEHIQNVIDALIKHEEYLNTIGLSMVK
jgi:predicted hydrolase (HD superfamily)